MAEYTHEIYEGTNYGLDPDFGNPIAQYVPTEQLATAASPQTANQLRDVSEKISTGARGVEVQMTFPQIAESIPNQHLEEINRLRKLTGTDLTLHGPMVEPTGINPRAGRWDESQREWAERQMWSSLERGHKLNPKGNIVVTFHSSGPEGLPEPETKVLTKDGKEVTTGLAVINQRTGAFGSLPKPTEEYLTGEKADVKTALSNYNEQVAWEAPLSDISLSINRSNEVMTRALTETKELEKEGKGKPEDLLNLFKLSRTNPEKYHQEISQISQKDPSLSHILQHEIDHLDYADINMRYAFTKLKEMYNEALEAAKIDKNQDQINKLQNFRQDMLPVFEEYYNKKNPNLSKMPEMAQEITKGVRLLSSMAAPKVFRPIKEFAIDEASKTFSNLAFKAYDEFGKTAPVISIENPPVGMGMTRAEDLKALVEETKRKFIEKAKEEKGVSESEARKQADKLIGITWDVGHINMLRKYGYGDKEIAKQTEKVAPYIKNIHLSDNFGMDHTELPMGMGDVPMKQHEEAIKKYGKQLKKIKRVIEAGNWYQHFGAISPFPATLEAFGSPVYAMKMAPYWNQQQGTIAGGYMGYGNMLPDVHFQTYGSGFSNLPPELGGQLTGRNRLGGAPMQ